MRHERPTRPGAFLLPAALLLLAFAAPSGAQEKPAAQSATTAVTPAAKTSAVTAASAPQDLARAAYESLGGDKFRDLKNMVLTGSVDLYAPNSTQSVPGTFGTITAGERVRHEIRSPFFSVSAIFDGERSYSSIRSFQMPPASKFGLPVLLKFAQPGYTVSALADKGKKKERAFRVTDPEGNATDFYVEIATGRITRYEIPFGDATYIMELKSFKTVDGVTVPTSFAQKLATSQGSFIAEFKVKEAKINQDLPADVFAIPAK